MLHTLPIWFKSYQITDLDFLDRAAISMTVSRAARLLVGNEWRKREVPY